MILQVPQNKVNRITLFSKFNYAFRNRYSTDFYYEPTGTGNSVNSHLYFTSDYPGIATVDWGDGIVEDYEFIKSSLNYYICAFRSLNVDYYRYPNGTTKGWSLGNNTETGEMIIPYPNHHYEDNDMNISRTIVISFSNDILRFYTNVIRMPNFPVLELPFLKNLSISSTSDIQEIPVDRLSRLTNLTSLALTSLGNQLIHIPDSLFELTSLTSLSWESGLNLSDIESSNIRKINKLINLTSLGLRSCYLPSYLKEFNELPKLRTLRIGNGSLLPDSPDFNEVSEINQNLTTFDWLMITGGGMGTRTNWGEQASGLGLQNLTSFSVTHARSLILDLPEYIKEMRSITSFNISSSLDDQNRIDTFVNNFYEYITNWECTTKSQTATDSKRNQFYGLSIVTYNSNYPDYACTPSGTLQAPEGFEMGVSDGNPTTPMEKIYVLTQNYNQSWTLKPADTDTLTNPVMSNTVTKLEYNQVIDNSMIVSKEGIIYKNEVITLSEEELLEMENIA